MKKIPSGIASFISLRRKEAYYVDKTRFIKSLDEAGEFLLSIRPRRMGTRSQPLKWTCGSVYFTASETNSIKTYNEFL